MSNVVKIHTDKTTAIADLKRQVEALERGECEAYAVILDYGQGDIRTGWYNAPLVKRQELISHAQIDIIMGVVCDNLVEE